MKYRVPVKIEFDGAVEIEAESEEDAENIAECYFCASIGNVSGSACNRILDWSVDNSGYVTRAENESIEEIEENENE